MQGRIVKVAGPLIVAENMADCKMYDVVKVGDNGLIGEVIELRGDKASVQVYEETSLLKVGDKVQAKITAIDFDKSRVSLSIRALLPESEEAAIDLGAEAEEAPAEETAE